jgi:protein gp37
VSTTTTSIEWTDRTWGPVRGCAPVSPGCTNCYAQRQAHRFAGRGEPFDGLTRAREKLGPVWTGQARFIASALVEPLTWKTPQRVFVNSMSDLFHQDITNEQIAAIFGVMGAARQHTFQVLTKRPERMVKWFEWLKERRLSNAVICASSAAFQLDGVRDRGPVRALNPLAPWPLPNVWIGVSVEDQQRADERIPLLLRTPAAVRFLSCEPLLSPIDLAMLHHDSITNFDALRGRHGLSLSGDCEKLDLVIVGGESGPGARPMHPAWARSLRDQCLAAGVPFFFKQWGDWAPFVDESRYTHGGAEKRPHLWLSETGEQGDCWIYDDDGSWSNWTGTPPPRDASGHTPVAIFHRSGKKAAGRALDGREWNEMPRKTVS